MDYGTMIRDTRKYLNIFQRDLACQNLSRNLLSNIEMGKTNLVPSKALILYRTFLTIAWKKSIHLDINFDEVLKNNKEYNELKEANKIINTLKTAIDNEEVLSLETINDAIDFSKKNDVGILRYFISLLAADNLSVHTENKLRLKTYFNALDFLIWLDKNEVVELFHDCLKKCGPLAEKLEENKAMAHYYELLLEYRSETSTAIEASTYFNLAYFNRYTNNLDEAMKYVNTFIDIVKEDSLQDLIDSSILKASMLTQMNKFNEALELYESLIPLMDDEKLAFQKTMCLGNSIFTISNNKLEDKKDILVKRIESLIDIINVDPEMAVGRIKLFSNIAQGYFFLDNLDMSKEYFSKSFENVLNDERNTKLITVLDEFSAYFLNEENIDFIVGKIININQNELTVEGRDKLLITLAKVINYAFMNNLDFLQKNELSEYVNNFKAEI